MLRSSSSILSSLSELLESDEDEELEEVGLLDPACTIGSGVGLPLRRGLISCIVPNSIPVGLKLLLDTEDPSCEDLFCDLTNLTFPLSAILPAVVADDDIIAFWGALLKCLPPESCFELAVVGLEDNFGFLFDCEAFVPVAWESLVDEGVRRELELLKVCLGGGALGCER